MNRRGFISALLGTAAATALPSEMWPFRKIFLPAQPTIVRPVMAVVDASRIDMLDLSYWAVPWPDYGAFLNLSRCEYPGRLLPMRSIKLEKQLDEWFTA